METIMDIEMEAKCNYGMKPRILIGFKGIIELLFDEGSI